MNEEVWFTVPTRAAVRAFFDHQGVYCQDMEKNLKGMSSRKWPVAVDLFCGRGGVTEGLKRPRFRVAAAVDNDPVSCATCRANHSRVKLYGKDIRLVDSEHVSTEA